MRVLLTFDYHCNGIPATPAPADIMYGQPTTTVDYILLVTVDHIMYYIYIYILTINIMLYVLYILIYIHIFFSQQNFRFFTGALSI